MSNEKKEKKPVTRLTVEQFNAKKQRYAGSAENDEIRHNVLRHCIHHETVLLDEQGKASSPLIGVPAQLTNHIAWTRDESSDRVGLKTYMPIYGKWPLGKQRGEDPRGDALMDLLQSLHADYCEWLDANPAIKKRIKLDAWQTWVVTAPAADNVVSPIKYEYYPSTHEKAGEIDTSKSPEARFVIWDMGMRDKDGKPLEARAGDLLIDNGEKKVLCCIVDDREKKDVRVTTEEHLREFCYEKGEFKKGKYPFKLFAQLKLLAPTVFWEKQRPAVFQLKASYLRVLDKQVGDGRDAISPEERAELDREAEESAAYYGIVVKRPAVDEAGAKPSDHVRDPTLQDEREMKKPRMTVEEMDFERALREADEAGY